MSNEEFDNLSEELLWQGSKVAVLRCDTRGAAPSALQCHGLHVFRCRYHLHSAPPIVFMRGPACAH